jgi:hypothetical protein
MQRRFTAILASLALVIALLPAPQAKALPRWKNYNVYYNCICGIWCNGQLVGQWYEDCDGNMTGWGSQPGENCTRYEITSSGSCGGE